MNNNQIFSTDEELVLLINYLMSNDETFSFTTIINGEEITINKYEKSHNKFLDIIKGNKILQMHHHISYKYLQDEKVVDRSYKRISFIEENPLYHRYWGDTHDKWISLSTEHDLANYLFLDTFRRIPIVYYYKHDDFSAVINIPLTTLINKNGCTYTFNESSITYVNEDGCYRYTYSLDGSKITGIELIKKIKMLCLPKIKLPIDFILKYLSTKEQYKEFNIDQKAEEIFGKIVKNLKELNNELFKEYIRGYLEKVYKIMHDFLFDEMPEVKKAITAHNYVKDTVKFENGLPYLFFTKEELQIILAEIKNRENEKGTTRILEPKI